MHNLSHPTLSLNHNWSNAHNLAAIYRSLSLEAERCRDAIADVKEMLIDRARSDCKGEEAGWKREWEETVNRLIEQSEGWRCVDPGAFFVRETHSHSPIPLLSWPTFWRMTLFALANLEQPLSVLEERASTSRWPLVPPEVRPPTEFVLQQASPLKGTRLVWSPERGKELTIARHRSDRFWSTLRSDRNENGGGCRV